MKYQLKSLTFGEILGEAFNLYMDNIPPLILLALISATASNLPSFFVAMGSPTINLFAPLLLLLLTFLITLPVTNLILAVYVNIISRLYLEKPLIWKEISTNVRGKVLSLIFLSLIVGLLSGLATILLIIPGIIVYLNYSLAMTVMIMEGTGISESMQRSKTLIKGKRWQMLGLWIIMGIISLIMHYLGSRIPEFGYLWFREIVSVVFNAITLPIGLIITVLMYFNCRIEKEGFALEHLAESFSFELDNTLSDDL